MTPKDKAKELINKFKPHADWNNEYGSTEEKANIKHAKECVLITVMEILAFMEDEDKEHEDCHNINSPKYRFWESVETEIKNL